MEHHRSYHICDKLKLDGLQTAALEDCVEMNQRIEVIMVIGLKISLIGWPGGSLKVWRLLCGKTFPF